MVCETSEVIINLYFAHYTGLGSFVVEQCTLDTVNGCKSVRDLYELSAKNSGDSPSQKFSVPVLWDRKTGTIVNNESSEILRIFNSAFDEWTTGPNAKMDFYPEAKRSEIDAVNELLYSSINDGVYKCGFARKQDAYNDAVIELYGGLDKVEEMLSKSRYLVGDSITEADIRLFMTLVRFDEVYVVYFKCNVKRIIDYPNIRNYCRDLYQFANVAECISMDHIKTHYFT
jgi:putative glutathione S-transferase